MKKLIFLLLLTFGFSACNNTPVVHRTRVTEQQITSMTGTDDDVYIYGGLGYSSWYNPLSIYNNGFYSYGYHPFYVSPIFYDRHNGYYSSSRYQTKIEHNHYNISNTRDRNTRPPPRVNSRQNKVAYEQKRVSTPPRGNTQQQKTTQQKTTQQRTVTPPRNTSPPKTTSPPRTTTPSRTGKR